MKKVICFKAVHFTLRGKEMKAIVYSTELNENQMEKLFNLRKKMKQSINNRLYLFVFNSKDEMKKKFEKQGFDAFFDMNYELYESEIKNYFEI